MFWKTWFARPDPDPTPAPPDPYVLAAIDAHRATLRAAGRRYSDEGVLWYPLHTEPPPQDGRWVWVYKPRPEHAQLPSCVPRISAYRWEDCHQGWFAGSGWWPNLMASHWTYMRAENPGVPPGPPQWEQHPTHTPTTTIVVLPRHLPYHK